MQIVLSLRLMPDGVGGMCACERWEEVVVGGEGGNQAESLQNSHKNTNTYFQW